MSSSVVDIATSRIGYGLSAMGYRLWVIGYGLFACWQSNIEMTLPFLTGIKPIARSP